MSDGKGEVVDFSDAPQQNGAFFSGTIVNGDLEEHAKNIGGKVPLVGGTLNITDTLFSEDGREPWVKLFNGEASRDDYFAIVLAILDVAKEIDGLVDDFKGIANQDIGVLIGWLVGTVLEELTKTIQPIEDAYGYVLGNPRRLETASEMWTEAGKSLNSLAEAYAEAGESIVGAWSSHSGDGAVTRIQDFIDHTQSTSDIATQVGELLKIFSDFSKRLIDMFNDLIAELIEAIIDAGKDVFTKGWGAVATILMDLEIMTVSYGVQLAAILVQAIQLFLAGADLTKQLEETLDHGEDIMNLLTGAA
ncbi:hypothetical protein [Salininema proteolyticum]|uniref:Uncharacterized protein n=1 Tax=Salininema proteolyticum TaxID=1607685 RepID=A0ABV8U3P6_9ACTN